MGDRTAFFDTSAFNAALDNGDISNLPTASCPQVLIELASTSKKDPERAQELCRTFARLVDQRIVRPAPEIAKLEIISFANQEKFPGVYYDNDSFKKSVKPVLDELCSGIFTNELVAPYIKSIQADKQRYLKILKKQIDINEREDAPDFERTGPKLPSFHRS